MVSLTERLKINVSIQYVIDSNVNGDQNRSETRTIRVDKHTELYNPWEFSSKLKSSHQAVILVSEQHVPLFVDRKNNLSNR